MPKDKYILIGSDVSNALATIIKAISGYDHYTCVTSVKSLGTIQYESKAHLLRTLSSLEGVSDKIAESITDYIIDSE